MNESIITNESEPAIADAPGSLLQRKCACGNHSMGGECGECGKKKSLLQRKATNSSDFSEVPAVVSEVLGSSGRPLDSSTRAFMEPRFGHGFIRDRPWIRSG